MKTANIFFVFSIFWIVGCTQNEGSTNYPAEKKMDTETLKDKIKGGWAGQTIGVTFGAPYEFRFNGTFIQDYQPLVWHAGNLKDVMVNEPGIYDDIYVDLTFVDVIEKYGIDAPVDSFASALAHSGYKLWHANQVARYNYLNGIPAPESGHWVNNPHADDIDYQIESDFAGLMSPGMPNAAAHIGDKVGHIMNYGDGWYGGVFVSSMYSLAFVFDDLQLVVNEALKMIPEQSEFYQCINDVIKWHKQYPDDWHQTWFEVQKKWSSDIGCSKGVFDPFNIDAKTNSAYVVIGLLYGNGDYGKTLEIATRAGQDADCNPSTAGGILGAFLGYDKIPAYWKQGLSEIEDMDFAYTTMSLNDIYQVGYKHALNMIKDNGGSVEGNTVSIKVQKPETVRFEKSFDGLVPTEKLKLSKRVTDTATFVFKGNGFILLGQAQKQNNQLADYIFNVTLNIDGKDAETVVLPTDFTTRRFDPFWKYNLPEGDHTIKIKINNPDQKYFLNISDLLIYSGNSKK